uniref:NADH-quinone oxidoreductase subunit A n=1 Tax=Buchnera aphidicola TaxID=9 RepID=UPI003F7A7698
MKLNKTQILSYIPVISFILTSLFICSIILFLGYILGGKSNSNKKNIPFESGITSIGNTKIRFSIHFYLIAMFFVIFDIESIYLYSWSVSIHFSKWTGFIEAILFITTLLISLFYLFSTKSLYWNEKKKNKY